MKHSTEHIKANADKWDRRARTYDEKRFDYFREIQKKLLSSINPTKQTRLLDLGCGTGWLVRTASELCSGEGRFVGIDASPRMIERAKSNSTANNAVEFYLGSADTLPFEDNSFDVVTCTNSFHHYPKPIDALLEARRIMRQGGRIYILDVTRDNLFAGLINRVLTMKEKEHVKFYSTREYIEMFRDAGLAHLDGNLSMYSIFKTHVGQEQV